MRLRPEPPRVIRISRRLLAALGIVVGLGIGGAFIYALQSTDRQVNHDELFTTDRQQTADGLQRLPDDYSGIPQLGPALPGLLPTTEGREVVPVSETGT